MTAVADLILQVRELSDHVNSNFVTDAEILRMLNQAHQDLYSNIIRFNETYFVTSTPITITGDSIALPDDVYKVNGIDMNNGSRTVTLQRFNWSERNKYNSSPAQFYGYFTNLRYTIVNKTIKFIPRPSASYTGTLWYTPWTPALVLGGDIDFPVAQFDCAMIYAAVAQVLAKEERSTTFWEKQAKESMDMVMQSIPGRDQADTFSVTDIYNMNTTDY